jgi:hypothetical protein
MGTLIIMIFASPVLAIVAKFFFLFKNNKYLVRKAKKIERSIYWSGTIRVWLESYTMIIVCASIQFT